VFLGHGDGEGPCVDDTDGIVLQEKDNVGICPHVSTKAYLVTNSNVVPVRTPAHIDVFPAGLDHSSALSSYDKKKKVSMGQGKERWRETYSVDPKSGRSYRKKRLPNDQDEWDPSPTDPHYLCVL
jgi:hypothetical protein